MPPRLPGFRGAVVAAAALLLAALLAPAGGGRLLTAPSVTGISPSSGTVCGGTSVTVTGSGFTGTTAVDFGTLGQPAQSFTVDSDTQITAVSPAGSSIVDIRVTTGGGTSPIVFADSFTYTGNATAPCVTAVSPSSGAGAGGTSVTLTGTDFTGATAVDFGSTAASAYTVVSSTQITATSPAGSGTVDVTVTNGNGTSPTGSPDHYTYAPTVSAVSPTGGTTAGGTSVTITGTGFTGASAVDFGSTAATSFSVDSGTQITAVSPAGSAGTVDVTVTASGLTSATGSGDRFTYTTSAAPTVNVVFPTSGPAAGGTSVTLTGVAFTGATAVHFGAAAATSFSVVSDTKITVVSPAGTGTVDVTVTGPGGTSAVQLLDHYTYEASPPTVSFVFPSSGMTAGGTSVTISGTNLADATAVDFGGTPAASFTVGSSTQITAVSPAGSAGTFDITVTSGGLTSATGGGDRFTYLAPAVPAPTRVAPAITLQPADVIANAGAGASFTAAATGTPAPTVQWQLSTDGGGSWSDLAGATSGTLTLTAASADEGNRYRAVFSNSAGSATSQAALLTVISPPDLALTMTYTGSLAPGAVGTYRLYAANVGAGPTTGAIAATDALPAGERLVRIAAGGGWSCTPQLRCTDPGPLQAGATLPPVTITVELPRARGQVVTNVAVVTTPGDANPANDVARFTLTVGGPEIAIGESVTVDDTPQISPPVTLSVGDGVTVGDGPQVSPPVTLSVGDGVMVGDGPQVSPPISLSVGDGVTVGDGPQVSPPVDLSVGDAVTITDTPKHP